MFSVWFQWETLCFPLSSRFGYVYIWWVTEERHVEEIGRHQPPEVSSFWIWLSHSERGSWGESRLVDWVMVLEQSMLLQFVKLVLLPFSGEICFRKQLRFLWLVLPLCLMTHFISWCWWVMLPAALEWQHSICQRRTTHHEWLHGKPQACWFTNVSEGFHHYALCKVRWWTRPGWGMQVSLRFIDSRTAQLRAETANEVLFGFQEALLWRTSLRRMHLPLTKRAGFTAEIRLIKNASMELAVILEFRIFWVARRFQMFSTYHLYLDVFVIAIPTCCDEHVCKSLQSTNQWGHWAPLIIKHHQTSQSLQLVVMIWSRVMTLRTWTCSRATWTPMAWWESPVATRSWSSVQAVRTSPRSLWKKPSRNPHQRFRMPEAKLTTMKVRSGRYCSPQVWVILSIRIIVAAISVRVVYSQQVHTYIYIYVCVIIYNSL